ncbi:ATP-dependent endonuclease [Nonomuraea sp. MG754425]|uniref:ATP-dependent nuclease n=1 Tax=Nonomuraea sp. MG754425 TaxID=2570319 RepID=UPI001F32D5DF|nr:AAA family ATPase [Nonomuraea sp. MG754425]
MKDFKPTTQLTSMKFADDAAFAGQSIQVEPFTVLCGAHGSGKSTLLHYIAECLQRESTHPDNPPFVGGRSWRRDQAGYLGGHIEFTIRDDEGHHILQQNLGLVDATKSQMVISHRRFKGCYPFLFTPFDSMLFPEFFDHHNFKQGNVEQAGAEILQTRKDLDALREILGVPYDEVVYVPSHIEDGAPIFPYVRARVGDAWLDSSSMSYGELVVHKLRWEVRHPSERTVILLDEPEANIAPRGHAALLDELARLARAANVQVIMTTHSPAFINRVPQDWIRICVRRGKSASLLTPSRPSDLRDALGVESPLKYFIVVEDFVAEAILRMILVAHRFPALSETEILKAGSWRDAITTVTGLSTSRRVRSAAVLDGDQRDDRAARTPSTGIVFLPGNAPPEKVVLEYAAQYPEELAMRLHCSEASINIYLAELAGLEHHQWLDLLSNRTGQDRQHCLRSAFSIWHSSPANMREAEELAQSIETLLLSE